MNNLSNVTTAVATFGTMVVAIFAAVSAYRSARAAERQAQHAEKTERLRLERDVSVAAQRTIALSISVADTVRELKVVTDALRNSGEMRGLNEHPRGDAAEKRLQSAITMQGEAIALLDRRDKWKSHTDEELFRHLSVMEGHFVQLERARIRLERDVERREIAIREESQLVG